LGLLSTALRLSLLRNLAGPAFACVRSSRFVQPFHEHPDGFVFVPGQANHQLTRHTPGAVNVNAAVDIDEHVAPVLANLS
jgi:hypothetical protein